MEIGGKQASKLTSRMYNKLMDLLAEEIAQNKISIELATEMIIRALLCIDDVVLKERQTKPAS